jgi:toxin ParE1/3/4
LEYIDLIARFIARDSVDRTALFIDRLIQATDRLQYFPFSGRLIPEINEPTCREIIYGSYRIMYRVKNDEVWITGIVHSARNWKTE